MSIRQTFLIAGFAIAGSGAVFAQAPPAPATPPAQTAPPAADRPNANCTPTQTNAQGTITPSTDGKSSENLGDKLAKSDGVLCPPSNVDPAMRAPAPKSDSSNTPVIPPPGSPGGDQSVRPK
ncbi:hypothetical protein RPMA_06485 [Tardiphaga alba]|uniref:Uncharacterized protein n=1 Tax=Tardiphaga alba TaxID=340268 RepID=A0ABX8A8A9_9BRAD|nr:hypothetical protein [Tardiphaga alba]QUS38520.1 hypothetical protein RPMA_06485 [Tardiphaga alba]